ncbi:MAG: molecular chaperone HtpG [Anaerolineae bacterium]
MSDQTTSKESIEFRAEVRQLLNILVHSLYTDREIFLRELISNASDALNRLQFEMLTNPNVVDPEAELAIRLRLDKEAKTLRLSDTGIGMTRAEIIEGLGTIAHSGASAFLSGLKEGEATANEIIGQFGVGFYSVFMVADRVEVTSRPADPEAGAHTWTSTGSDTYSLQPADKRDRGTEVVIHLRDDATEFAEEYRLRDIIKKHSDFVSFPIYLGDEETPVNQQTALWRQSPREVEDEDYQNFYRQLTLDFEEPLLRVHTSIDAPVQMSALLFVPSRKERGLLALSPRKDDGLKLYSRKVLIQEYCQDLLPPYFRFVQGVVDSEDLPLNISRETVQANRVMERMKGVLTRRLVNALAELAEENPEKYAQFWGEFGTFLKEGVATEATGREPLYKLLRFPSSKLEADRLTSLKEYVERMPETQEAIYYILGDSVASATHNPHLDYFKQHDLEVLYLTDPMDNFMLIGLQEFDGRKLQNVETAEVDLAGEAQAEAEAEEGLSPDEFAQLLARFKTVLGERVEDVRESKRLTTSPCRLVSPEGATNVEMDRVRRILDKDFETPKKVLEINRRHAIITGLAGRMQDLAGQELVDTVIEQLFESSLLGEGIHPNPAEMIPRIHKLIEAAVK